VLLDKSGILKVLNDIRELLREARLAAAGGGAELTNPSTKVTVTDQILESLSVGNQVRFIDANQAAVDAVLLVNVRLLAVLIGLHAQMGIEDGDVDNIANLGHRVLGEDGSVARGRALVEDTLGHLLDRLDHLGDVTGTVTHIGIHDLVDHEIDVPGRALFHRQLVPLKEEAREGRDASDIVVELVRQIRETARGDKVLLRGRELQHGRGTVGVQRGVSPSLDTRGALFLDPVVVRVADHFSVAAGGCGRGDTSRKTALRTAFGPSMEVVDFFGLALAHDESMFCVYRGTVIRQRAVG